MSSNPFGSNVERNGLGARISAASPSRRTVVAGIGATIFAPAVRAQNSLREISIPISSTSFATASARAADVLGCYARNGLSVKLPVMDTGSNLTTALISGSVQVVLGGAGEQVASRVRGQEIVALANVYWGLAASLILSKEVADRTGVSPTASVRDKLKALDGLLIAAPSPTSTYTSAFKGGTEGVGAKLRFTYMAQPAMIAALETGAVQGCIAGAPLWGVPVANGKALVWLSGPKGELPPENLPASITGFHAMRTTADANPGLMKQVIDSYRDFSNILEKNPEQVRAAFAKLYPDVDTATMDVLFKAENNAWKWRPITVADMKKDIDFMVASGIPLAGIEKVDPATMIYAAK